MDRKRIAMSQKELARVRIMTLLTNGHLDLQEAARNLGLSIRQTRRLKERFQAQGPEGLVHGNRGRPASNHLVPLVRQRILALVKEIYADLNDSHFQEILAEREGIHLGRETLRTILRQAGHPPKRKRRAPKHRERRERRSAKGLMVLWDGSPHHWFGPERPPWTMPTVS